MEQLSDWEASFTFHPLWLHLCGLEFGSGRCSVLSACPELDHELNHHLIWLWIQNKPFTSVWLFGSSLPCSIHLWGAVVFLVWPKTRISQRVTKHYRIKWHSKKIFILETSVTDGFKWLTSINDQVPIKSHFSNSERALDAPTQVDKYMKCRNTSDCSISWSKIKESLRIHLNKQTWVANTHLWIKRQIPATII